MTTRAFAALALKLMGVFILLGQIALLTGTVAQLFVARSVPGRSLRAEQGLGPDLMPVMLAGFMVMLTVIFILLADSIASRMVPGDAPLPVVESVGADALMAIGLSAVGALLAFSGAVQSLDWVVRFFAHRDAEAGGAFNVMMVGFRQFDIFEPVLRLGLGLALMLAPRWVMQRLGLPR